jgi:hypothetical protein
MVCGLHMPSVKEADKQGAGLGVIEGAVVTLHGGYTSGSSSWYRTLAGCTCAAGGW